MVRWFILFGLLLAVFSAYPATIRVTTDRNPVSLGETFKLIFEVEGKQDGEPDFSPLNKNFQLLGTGQSSAFNMINGKTSQTRVYTLTLMPLKHGKIAVPAIRFGKDKSKPVTVKVQPAGGQAQQANKDQSFFMTAEPDVTNPYVQQQIIVKVKIYRTIHWTKADLAPVQSEGVEIISRQIGKDRTYKEKYKGKNYTVTELRFALFPQESGDLTLLPLRLTARVAANRAARKGYKTRVIHSEPVNLTVRPIPPSFTGKHWVVARDIRLQEAWSSELAKLKAGEPVTRTLAIIGDGVGVGQLPDIEIEDMTGIKIYPEQPENQEQAGKKGFLSTRTLKFALIPSDGGMHKLPSIEVPWWNSTTDKMEIAAIPSVSLNVIGTAAAALPPTGSLIEVEPDAVQILPEQPVSAPWHMPGDARYWSLFLLLLWLVTLSAWWRTRRLLLKETPQTPIAPEKPAKALRNLRKACQTDKPEDIQIALLDWGRAIWPDHPPHSLEAIAQRVSSPLSDEIESLSRHLYSGHATDWDGHIIEKEASQFEVMANSSPQEAPASLEPLYR